MDVAASISPKKIDVGVFFSGRAVGIKAVQDGIWLASWKDSDLEFFDREVCVLEPLENPFGPKALPR